MSFSKTNDLKKPTGQIFLDLSVTNEQKKLNEAYSEYIPNTEYNKIKKEYHRNSLLPLSESFGQTDNSSHSSMSVFYQNFAEKIVHLPEELIACENMTQMHDVLSQCRAVLMIMSQDSSKEVRQGMKSSKKIIMQQALKEFGECTIFTADRTDCHSIYKLSLESLALLETIRGSAYHRYIETAYDDACLAIEKFEHSQPVLARLKAAERGGPN